MVFRETPRSPITIEEKELFDRGQIPPTLGLKLYRGAIDEDRANAIPATASASNPLALASSGQLTQDQVDSFPTGASSSNKLLVSSGGSLVTTDEKASFPATASAANPLSLARRETVLPP